MSDPMKVTQFEQVEVAAPAFDAYPQENIISGALGSNRVSQTLEVGTFESENYKKDVSGWMLSPSEAQMPTLTIVGSLKHGKTSWTDSVNSGYYLGDEGVYIGAASDTTNFKFTISSGLLSVTGAIMTGAGSDIKGQYVDALSVGKLTSGNILSQTITMGITGAAGDCYIGGGHALDATNWQGGDGSGGAFLMGLDDSDSDKAKFFVGNISTNKYLKFDGNDILLAGKAVTIGGAVAGENILIDKSLTLSDGTKMLRVDLTWSASPSGDACGGTDGGGVGQFIKCATRFSPPTIKISSISCYVKKVGSPTDSFHISLWAGSASAPTGNELVSTSIAASSLTGSYVLHEFTISDYQLTTSNYYWIVFSRVGGANDDANFYMVQTHESSGGSDPYSRAKNVLTGSGWGTIDTNWSHDIKIYLTPSNGSLYLSSSYSAASADGFIGFSAGTITDGNVVPISFLQQNGLSGLTAGGLVYLQDYPGTVGASTGTYSKSIGKAFSTTSMIINYTF